jgi:hypothetical protein
VSDNPTVVTVTATLRMLAGYVPLGPDELSSLADDVERDWDGVCCPVCEEVTCDEGCPLEDVRAKLGA